LFSDIVGLVTGRAANLEKTGCSFVGGDGLELCTSYSSSCHHHLCHP